MTTAEMIAATLVGIFASATGGVFVMVVIAVVWGRLNKMPPYDFFDRHQVWTDEVQEHAPYRNRLTDSHLYLVMGKGDDTDFDSQSFMLDVPLQLPVTQDTTRPAA